MREVPRGGDRGGPKAAAGGRVVAPEPEAERSLADSLLPWLIRGVHVVHVDRRRRSGAPAGLRRLLADDAPALRESEPWRDLASGLHRQAVSQGLHQLRPREKEVIRLAYLEGQTNQEIADRLGVSVSTVRRRIQVALQDMEAFVRRTGGALSALVLVAGAALAARSARITRNIWTSSPGMHSVAALVSSAAIVSTVAIVTLAPATTPTTPIGPAKTQATPSLAIRQSAPPAAVDAIGTRPDSLGVPGPGTADAPAKPAADEAGTPDASGDSDAPAAKKVEHPNRGCDGNPTSAPPAVPVGPRNNQASGAPISHPTAGGCRS